MKDFSQLLNSKRIAKNHSSLDQQSVFYIFSQVIKIEYGRMGSENIRPVSLSGKSILVKTGNMNWANEISLSMEYLVWKMNEQLGGNEIVDLKVIY